MRLMIDSKPALTAIRRAAIALHIYVLNQRYKALGNYLTEVDANRQAAELERKNILMSRFRAKSELNKLGGI